MCCGNSSVGRAQPCQGWGREFESRFPLKCMAEWQSGYASACKAADTGSIPVSALKVCPGGGIGRRKGLKIPRSLLRAGSSPALGNWFSL